MSATKLYPSDDSQAQVSTSHDHGFAESHFARESARLIEHDASTPLPDGDAASGMQAHKYKEYLKSWYDLVVPAGKVSLKVPAAHVKDIKMQAVFAGFSVVLEASGSSPQEATHLEIMKPEYSSGSKAPLQQTGKVALNFGDLHETDLIDEDSLLDSSDAQLPSYSESGGDCSTKRRACKNCSCGRAEREAGNVDTGDAAPKSACGNCHKGDAFRCATCPYLGQPAFVAKDSSVKINLSDDI